MRINPLQLLSVLTDRQVGIPRSGPGRGRGRGGGEGGRRDGRESQPLNNRSHDRQAADRGAQQPAPPSGPGADPRRSGLGHWPGRSLGTGGRRRRTNPYF